jgi:hypothetical protein
VASVVALARSSSVSSGRGGHADLVPELGPEFVDDEERAREWIASRQCGRVGGVGFVPQFGGGAGGGQALGGRQRGVVLQTDGGSSRSWRPKRRGKF